MSIYTVNPICLYIKRHKITGKKYFGKTTKPDPVKYTGSGKYWIRHINKHGKDHVETIWTQWFTNQQECTEYALRFSVENNIVESDEWANQMLEDGLTGNGSPGRKSSALAIATVKANNKKRLENGTHLFLNKEFKQENAKKLLENGTHPVFKLHTNWTCSHCGFESRGNVQYKQHIKSKKCLDFFIPKETSKDRVTKGTHNFLGSELQKKRVENGTHPSQFQWTCEVCNKSGKGKGIFTRFHGNNCKLLTQK